MRCNVLVPRPEFDNARIVSKLLAETDTHVWIVTDECGKSPDKAGFTYTTQTLRDLPEVERVEQSRPDGYSGSYDINVYLKGDGNAHTVHVYPVDELLSSKDDMSASAEVLELAEALDRRSYNTKSKKRHFDGVVSGSEYTAVVAEQIAERLNTRREAAYGKGCHLLPCNPPEAIMAFRSKIALQEAAEMAGIDFIPTVRMCADLTVMESLLDRHGKQWDEVIADLEDGIPYVFKPDNKAGSLAVHVVYSVEELMHYYHHYREAGNAIDEGGFVATEFVVQRYIDVSNEVRRADGDVMSYDDLPEYSTHEGEFSVEGFIGAGEVNFLSITRTLLDGVLERGHVTQANIAGDLRTEIIQTIRTFLEALGMKCGPFHIECRVQAIVVDEAIEYQIYLFDAGARPPGCTLADAVKRQTGRDMHQITIDTRLNRSVATTLYDALYDKSGRSGLWFPQVRRPGYFIGLSGVDALGRCVASKGVQMGVEVWAPTAPKRLRFSGDLSAFKRAEYTAEDLATFKRRVGALRFTVPEDVRCGGKGMAEEKAQSAQSVSERREEQAKAVQWAINMAERYVHAEVMPVLNKTTSFVGSSRVPTALKLKATNTYKASSTAILPPRSPIVTVPSSAVRSAAAYKGSLFHVGSGGGMAARSGALDTICEGEERQGDDRFCSISVSGSSGATIADKVASSAGFLSPLVSHQAA